MKIFSSARPRKGLWIAVAIVAIAAVIVIPMLLKPAEASAPLPVVEVEPVKTSDVNIYGEYVGRITPQHYVEVRARVEGYVEKILFEEGTRVQKGQPLFLIDKKVYQARVERARAQHNKAQAQLKKAERDLARIQPLYQQNAASQLDLDNAQAALETARAEAAIALADLTQAELTLSYTTVTAPISGYVTDSKVDQGALVGPNSKSLLTGIVESDTVMVNFSMTALDYQRSRDRNVNLGHHEGSERQDSYVTVTLADGSVYPHRGNVDFASPQVDPSTGTFMVRAAMPNPERALLPGEATRVKVLTDVRMDAIEVPSKAIEVERGGAYVYVVRPDSVVERRYVETGPELGNTLIVERGLAEGENIVVEGYNKLHHGMKVRPVAVPDSLSAAL